MSECIPFVGKLDHDGYGRFKRDGKKVSAHRAAYEAYHSRSIPPGLEIDHLCRNRACLNAEHMEVVNRKTNTLRGTSPSARNALKTHCDQGHEFTPENTYTWRGWRMCRECRRAADRKRGEG